MKIDDCRLEKPQRPGSIFVGNLQSAIFQFLISTSVRVETRYPRLFPGNSISVNDYSWDTTFDPSRM